ncbi:MAG: aminoglycoside phosphotransferase family protein, partial [Actinobacteria bacterium]
PLGADVKTAVYRVISAGEESHFLKLRKANFAASAVSVPRHLYDSGLRQIIPPLRTRDGRLWAALGDYACILYPYVDGRDGFSQALSDDQWRIFGAALRAVHGLDLPAALREALPVEDWSPRWREAVRGFQAQAGRGGFSDPLAARMAAYMRARRVEIDNMIERAERLAAALRDRPPAHVLCHADVHAGNLLLAADGALYIVDWDDPILAPKERDLMFVGGGIGGIWQDERESALFYQGYGAARLDLTALAYYRYERIIADIAAYCEQILLVRGGQDDRERGYGYFTSNFDPGGVLDIARQTDRMALSSR